MGRVPLCSDTLVEQCFHETATEQDQGLGRILGVLIRCTQPVEEKSLQELEHGKEQGFFVREVGIEGPLCCSRAGAFLSAYA